MLNTNLFYRFLNHHINLMNTTDYLDSSEHVIKAIYYNSSGDYAETEPMMLFINNSKSKPISSQIYKILKTRVF